MRATTLVGGAALVASATAARPANVSMCDYYTTALLGNNTAANQQAVLTLVVNTAVIGNYSDINVGVSVNGILNPGKYYGQDVNLLPYFSGGLSSTNEGGPCGVKVNFLDGGGAAPLLMSMPANDTTSNQYYLLTHLYQYFAYLLGCSMYGTTVSPYAGDPSMYQVHKYMDLEHYQNSYFIEQVGRSALSFGVTAADVGLVAMALEGYFNKRCLAPAAIPAYKPAKLQSICIDCSCPVANASECSMYGPVIAPTSANMSCGPGMVCPA